MAEPTLRVGVLGAGWFASRRHLPDLLHLPDVRVVAACRRDPEALEQFCDHFQIPGRFTSYDEMIDTQNLDAVVVSTPHAAHFDHARRCLERGIHVLLEKPLALKAEEGEQLIKLARERNRVLLVALNPPYWSHCHVLRDWLRQGRIGELEAAEITWINCAGGLFGTQPLPEQMPGVVRPTAFRQEAAQGGGGHLMDGGQHNVSELLWATESHPRSLSAAMDRLPVDLRASVSIALASGAAASITGVTDSRLGQRRAHSAYYGSGGTIHVDVMPFRLTLERPGREPETLKEDEMPPVASPAEDLVRCIRQGGEPLGSPQHALAVTSIIEKAYASAARSV